MLRLTELKLPLEHPPEALRAAILKRLELADDALLSFSIFKRSYDARKKDNLLLVYTGTTRMSDGIIKDQVGRYEQGEADTIHGLRRQKELAVEMKNTLLRRRLNDFGDLLHEAWESKKKLSPKISNSKIDEMYEAARKAGAVGGKITGAGGGGYMLFYCCFERKHRVAEALRKLGGIPVGFGFDFNGLQTWRVDSDSAMI